MQQGKYTNHTSSDITCCSLMLCT